MTQTAVAIGEAMVEFAPTGGDQYRRGYAGDTYNTLWHMAQVMGDRCRCRFVTRVGTDRTSDGFVEELTADGLDPSGIIRDEARTMGLYVIDLDGAERSFQYWRGQSAARHLADDAEALARSVAGADLIHVSGITLAILPDAGRRQLFDQLAAAQAGGARIAFDPNYRPRLWASADAARAAFGQMLTLADIALPSFDDEQALWGDATPAATAARIGAAGVREVIVKNGAEGVQMIVDGAAGQIATTPAQIVRDTTGAGDAFNAGYLAARMTGLSAAHAVAAGQRLSAEILAHPGGRIPRERVRQMNVAAG